MGPCQALTCCLPDHPVRVVVSPKRRKMLCSAASGSHLPTLRALDSAQRSTLLSSHAQAVFTDPAGLQPELGSLLGPVEQCVGSHTGCHFPGASLICHGLYRVVGPAVLTKRGDLLVAHLLSGSRIEIYDDTCSPHAITHESLVSQEHFHGSGSTWDSLDTLINDLYYSSTSPADGSDTPLKLSYIIEPGQLPVDAGAVASALAVLGGGLADPVHGSGAGEASLLNLPVAPECVLYGTHVELGLSPGSHLCCGIHQCPDDSSTSCNRAVDDDPNNGANFVPHAALPGLSCRLGRTYLNVRRMPRDTSILLSHGEELCHPVRITPEPPCSGAAVRGP